MTAIKYLLTALTILALTMAIAAQDLQTKVEASDQPNDGESLINAASYPFSALTGIGLEDMSTGTTQIVAPRADVAASPLTDIGFTFRFDGINYTTFGTNGDGAVALGRVWDGQSFQNQSINSGTFPKLMPYWDDLCVGPSGKVHYKTVGSPGSRRLVIEWLNMQITRSGVDCSTNGPGIFQMWLFEQTGQIQFVYGNGMTQVTTRGGYTVGIHVGEPTNFASVTTSNSSVSYTQTNDTQIAPISAGTSFVFSPVVPAAPAGGNITQLAQTSLRLNWTDNAMNETGYEVRRSTDGVNYSLIGTYPADTITANDSGLTPSTQYFYKVNAVSAGAFSEDLIVTATTNPSRIINSTSTGGLWSAPSTWVGGSVPDGGDYVTIVAGASVIIDTAALAGSITVGGAGNLAEAKELSAEGTNPATLRFGETATFTLTVADDILIGANDSLTTGGGSANQHVLSVGGDITNNGTLDLSTNNGAAGATINFYGTENAAFGGTGATTDVFLITVNKSRGVVVDLTSSNFTVAGSAADTALSGYLIIFSGTFKISGTFSGTHRTFPSGTYSIPADGGLWLNNPNYTITGQAGIASVFGYLRVSAGTYNVGVGLDHSMRLREGSTVIIEGGDINTAAMFTYFVAPGATAPLSLTQTGGTVTTCTVGSNSGCFEYGGGSTQLASANLSAGKVVIQNPGQPVNRLDFACLCNMTNSFAVQFGNALSLQPAIFKSGSPIPNFVIDTSAGGHVVKMSGSVGTINIGPGGTLDIENRTLNITGETIVNNGFIKGDGDSSVMNFTGANTVYSGAGTTTGPITRTEFRGQSFTNNATGLYRARQIRLYSGNILGANNFVIGNNDTVVSSVMIGGESGTPGTFDSAPQFQLGTGGQSVTYLKGNRTTGPEINPARSLIGFAYSVPSQEETLTIGGGELTVGTLSLARGRVLATGGNSILHYGNLAINGTGFVTGTIIRKFTTTEFYDYPLGLNERTPATFIPSALGTNPAYVAIGTSEGPMPGLDPLTSLNKSWTMTVNGGITGSVIFEWEDADVRGPNEANYKLWRSNGGPPELIPFGLNAPINKINTGDRTDFDGRWGVGEQVAAAPVSVSGTVRTAGGMPIRNALVRVTGPGLGAPFVEGYTANLGTYFIDGLRVGETYTVQVGAKRYRFTPSSQSVTPSGNATGVDFTANPQE